MFGFLGVMAGPLGDGVILVVAIAINDAAVHVQAQFVQGVNDILEALALAAPLHDLGVERLDRCVRLGHVVCSDDPDWGGSIVES